MGTDLARPMLATALFFVILPGFLLLILDPGSAAFVAAALTLVVGAIFTAVVITFIRLSNRPRR